MCIKHNNDQVSFWSSFCFSRKHTFATNLHLTLDWMDSLLIICNMLCGHAMFLKHHKKREKEKEKNCLEVNFIKRKETKLKERQAWFMIKTCWSNGTESCRTGCTFSKCLKASWANHDVHIQAVILLNVVAVVAVVACYTCTCCSVYKSKSGKGDFETIALVICEKVKETKKKVNQMLLKHFMLFMLSILFHFFGLMGKQKRMRILSKKAYTYSCTFICKYMSVYMCVIKES